MEFSVGSLAGWLGGAALLPFYAYLVKVLSVERDLSPHAPSAWMSWAFYSFWVIQGLSASPPDHPLVWPLLPGIFLLLPVGLCAVRSVDNLYHRLAALRLGSLFSIGLIASWRFKLFEIPVYSNLLSGAVLIVGLVLFFRINRSSWKPATDSLTQKLALWSLVSCSCYAVYGYQKNLVTLVGSQLMGVLLCAYALQQGRRRST